jgi:hypothetical protein
MKHYLWGEPIFDTSLLVIKNCTHQQAEKLLKKIDYTGDSSVSNDTHGYTFKIDESSHAKGHNFWVVWLKDGTKTSTLVHECTHLVIGIMNEKGIEDNETFAYLMGYYYKVLAEEKIDQ